MLIPIDHRFSVLVMPPECWPSVATGAGGQRFTLPLGRVLLTVQPAVDSARVWPIIQKLKMGAPSKPVELFDVGGRWWIIDGHHTLAAHRFLGLDAPALLARPGPFRRNPPAI